MVTVTLEEVSKEYGDLVAVDDINLEIADGELAVIVGPSGCGKTTTLRMIAGLESPSNGAIRFGDRDVTAQQPQDRDISMVFQDLALYPHMTAAENIGFPLRADGELSETEIETAVSEAATLVDCTDLLEQKTTELSGGQQQRVALARAFVTEPAVFLLDEPFSDLDELLQRNIRSAAMSLQEELGVTMIHVTHNQEEAMTMADRIVVMRDGEIEQTGSPTTVFNEPRTLFVALFIGSPQINQFDCRIETASTPRLVSEEISFLESSSSVPGIREATTNEVSACVRPQHLNWRNSPPEEGVSFPVSVDVIEQLGTEDVVHCLTESGREVTLVVDAGTVDERSKGHAVSSLDRIHLFDGRHEDAKRLH